MKAENLGDVRGVALRIVKLNRPYYSKALLKLIPKSLLEMILRGENLFQAETLLDQIRWRRETEFAKMLGCRTRRNKKVVAALNSKLNSLPPEQEKVKKEIKFLFNVAATVIHQ